MKASSSTLVLLFAVLPLLSAGCSSTRERLTVRQDGLPSGQLTQSDASNGSAPATSLPNDDDEPAVTSVETVAYQEDGGGNSPSSDDAENTTDGDSETLVEMFVEPSERPWVGDGLTLGALEQLALQNNPSIRQASAAAAKASGFRTQVGLKPNPTIGYFGEEIGNEGAGGLHGAYLSQTFVRGDKLAWNQQVIGHDVDAVLWQVEAQRQRVRTDVRIQFYEALAAQKRLRLAHEFRNVAEKGVSVSKERLKALVGTRPDILQSEIQLSEVDLVIQQAEFEFNAAWIELTAIAGVPHLAPTVLVGELNSPVDDRDVETVYARITSESPLLASAYARVNRARSNLQRQRNQAIPNVTAQVGVGHDDATGDEFANVQLSLPLPVHNKNQGNIRAAHAEYCEATQNVQRIRMQIRRDLARVMREYQIARATVGQYEESILPKAEETLELIQQAQQGGQFDFLRVLTARRAYFDASQKYVVALGDLAKAHATIDGLLLTDGLSNVVTYDVSDDLRDQSLSGQ